MTGHVYEAWRPQASQAIHWPGEFICIMIGTHEHHNIIMYGIKSPSYIMSSLLHADPALCSAKNATFYKLKCPNIKFG